MVENYDTENNGSVMNIDVASLSTEKRRLLNLSINEPKFYIIINDYELLPSFTSYIVEYGILQPGGVTVDVRKTRTRYSKLLKLHDMIVNCYHSKNLPPFPPKLWWGNNTDDLARKRLFMMNPFIKSLNQYKDVIRLPQFKDIFEH